MGTDHRSEATLMLTSVSSHQYTSTSRRNRMQGSKWLFCHNTSHYIALKYIRSSYRDKYPIGSVCMPYMVTFTINIPQMLAYIPYVDRMGMDKSKKQYIYIWYVFIPVSPLIFWVNKNHDGKMGISQKKKSGIVFRSIGLGHVDQDNAVLPEYLEFFFTYRLPSTHIMKQEFTGTICWWHKFSSFQDSYRTYLIISWGRQWLQCCLNVRCLSR